MFGQEKAGIRQSMDEGKGDVTGYVCRATLHFIPPALALEHIVSSYPKTFLNSSKVIPSSQTHIQACTHTDAHFSVCSWL